MKAFSFGGDPRSFERSYAAIAGPCVLNIRVEYYARSFDRRPEFVGEPYRRSNQFTIALVVN